MRRARLALGALLVLAGATFGLWPTHADASTLAQAGWWWRATSPDAQTLPVVLPLPPPPTVPEGGLMVAGAPDGATAIAAVHFDLTDDETSPVLTLTVAPNGDKNGASALMAACLTGSVWQPASAGTWDSKPFPACEQGSVTGLRADDGKTWTFALDPLLSDGVLDVTIVPGTVADLPPEVSGSTFELIFEPPTAASLQTTPGTPFDPSFDVPDFGAVDPGFTSPEFGGTPSFTPAPTPAFTPSLPAAEQGLTATAPVAQQANRPLPTTPIAEVGDHRVLGAIAMVLCGVALLWSSQQPTPAPRRLGTFDSAVRHAPVEAAVVAETAGLGRFARPRRGPAPPL
jgi:hypothetical protein